jgi:hypothetical protein
MDPIIKSTTTGGVLSVEGEIHAPGVHCVLTLFGQARDGSILTIDISIHEDVASQIAFNLDRPLTPEEHNLLLLHHLLTSVEGTEGKTDLQILSLLIGKEIAHFQVIPKDSN